MRQPETLRLEPGIDAVDTALAWLARVADRDHWPQKAAFRLQLCLDEALTNIVSHGFPKGTALPEAEILLQLGGDNGRIMLDIFDNGVAFDPTHIVSAPLADSLDDAIVGGHGLRLMRHYLQDLSYLREGDRNRLRLVLQLDAV